MGSKDINIKFKGDSSNFDKSLKNVAKSVDSVANQIKKSSIVSLATSFNNVSRASNIVKQSLKKVNDTIKELEEAYRNQIKAEKQLEVAAQNNPYLDHDSVRQLEDYASHLQSISTVGDEQLIPMMAQLASAGRTQEEIQNIMSAALDLSASGMMSLDTAVSQLNKTFSGSTGQLGNQISTIKNLTEEQLKNGEAVKIIAEQFKGMAEETALATGSSEQLKNSVGDLKEEMGAVFEESAKPMRRFFTEAFSNIAGMLSQLRKTREDVELMLEAIKRIQEGKGTLEDFEMISSGAESLINKNLDKIDALQAKYDALSERKKKGTLGKKYLAEIQELEAQIDNYIVIIENSNENIQKKQTEALWNLVEEAKNAESVSAKQTILLQAQAYETKLKNSKDYKKAILTIQDDITSTELQNEMKSALAAEEAYEKKIAAYKEEIKQRKEIGETISDEDAILGEIQVRQKGLFELVEKYSMLDWNSKEVKEYAEEISNLYTLLQNGKNTTPETKEKLDSEFQQLKFDAESLLLRANSFVGTEESLLSDQITREIAALEEYMGTLNKTGKAYEELASKKKALEDLSDAVKVQEVKDKVAEITDVIVNYTEKFAEISNGITDIIRKNNEDQTNAELTELSEQYTQGIISYEEYCEKKGELNKKAAQEEYKLKMWEWTSSLLQATANIAQGIAASLKVGMPAGAILAALTGAAGAVQIAAITANKPKAPSFATGGIVPGTSYSGDKVQANVNSGEMILNAQQQANLWKAANSNNTGSGAVVNMPITIENNTNASVKTSLNHKGLKVIIDDIVNTSMNQGTYNDSMNQAKNVSQGVRYL